MNIAEYIASGILQEYSLGVLSEKECETVEKICLQHPEVKQELLAIEDGVAKYAALWAKTPLNAVLQDRIWDSLENINKEKAADINNLPVINKYSDADNWRKIVTPLIPKEIIEDQQVHVLRATDKISQTLIISKVGVEEEEHTHELESFIILDGECACYVGDDIIKLGPGGYIEIPLHVKHNVKILSPYVVAVLQHIAV